MLVFQQMVSGITTQPMTVRFCFDHGQNEWLLGTPDRWMRPGDFKVSEAEAKLEAELRDYH